MAGPRRLRNFVSGEHTDVADGRTLDLHDPSTGEVFATSRPRDLAISGDIDVDVACTGFGDYTRIKHVMSYIGS